jgi:hypothetical protein
MSAHWALQEALVTALAADAGLKALIGDPARIYDGAPRGVAFPYLSIGAGAEGDWSVQSGEGVECRLILHAWSRYAGRKEIKDILGRVRTVLHDASLGVAGWRLINLRCEAVEYPRTAEGAFHGLARFRAALEPI